MLDTIPRDNQVKIGNAEVAEIDALFRLHVRALGHHIKYTIYQTEHSRDFFSDIAMGRIPGQRLVGARVGDEPVGFYLAVAGDESILNYIAVSESHRHNHIGSLLLADFEATSKASGARKVVLDVFEDNRGALSWYLRHGYQEVSRRHFLRLRLSTIGGNCREVDACSWQAALDEEVLRGFSKYRVQVAGQELVIGLIGGRTYRILDKGRLSLTEALMNLQSVLGHRREVVCECGVNESLPHGIEQRDCSIRMEKYIER